MKTFTIITTVTILGLFRALGTPDVIKDFAKGHRDTWSSEGHVKAKGIKMKISYPKTWKALEGNRPNILQKFIGESKEGMNIVTLTTKTLPAPFNRELKVDEKKEILAKEVIAQMIGGGSKLLSHKITKLDGELCAMAEFITINEGVGLKIGQKILVFVVPRPGTLLFIQCATGGDASKGIENIEARYTKVRHLFTLIGASCVFIDKWEE